MVAVSTAMCPFSRRGRVFSMGVRFFFFGNGRELLSFRGESLEGVSPPPPFNPAKKIIFNFLPQPALKIKEGDTILRQHRSSA
jgi:hypothetical protein